MEDKNQISINPFAIELQKNDSISDSFQGRAEISLKKVTIIVGMQVDSKDLIYGLKYVSGEDNLSIIFSIIERLAVNKKISGLDILNKTSIINTIEKNDSTKQWIQDNDLNIELCLSLVRSAVKNFTGYPGAYCEQNNISSSNIICRCMGLTFNGIEASFLKNKGNIKDTKIETKVSALCGGCKDDVLDVFEQLERSTGYYNGVPNPTWVYKIKEALKQFDLYSPANFVDLKFEIIKYSMNTVKIRCTRPGTTPNRMEIEETMSNYLRSEIDKEIFVSIIT